MARLSDAEIKQALEKLSGWERRGNALERVLEFPSFKDAMNFVNRVAAVAEEVNHHPDITVNYNRVTLLLTSHDSGGVTGRDISFAARINQSGELKAA